jgi:hypothetical protein
VTHRLIFRINVACLLLVGGASTVVRGNPHFAAPTTSIAAEPAPPTVDVPALGPSACPWRSESGQRLLNRPLGAPLTFSQATVVDIVRELQLKRHVPLSVIESDAAARITIGMREGTLRDLLDRIVALAPVYRYRFVGARLVIYPVDPLWDLRIDNLRLGPGERRWVGEALVLELRHRVPALASLNPPWTFGDPGSFVYRDLVSVAGPASIVELLAQLLGERASASFVVARLEGKVTTLWLSSEGLIASLKLTAPTTILKRPGETAQLTLVGSLYDGTRQVLTAAICSTEYVSGNARVVKVSPEGLVTAVGDGESYVNAIAEDEFDSLPIRVEFRGR